MRKRDVRIKVERTIVCSCCIQIILVCFLPVFLSATLCDNPSHVCNSSHIPLITKLYPLSPVLGEARSLKQSELVDIIIIIICENELGYDARSYSIKDLKQYTSRWIPDCQSKLKQGYIYILKDLLFYYYYVVFCKIYAVPRICENSVI